jgi:hypothetical protein
VTDAVVERTAFDRSERALDVVLGRTSEEAQEDAE